VIGVSFRMAFAGAMADGRPGLALVELSVVEQRYRAVLEAAAGLPVTEVAARYEVSRQSVHAWIIRYREGGLGALADRPRRPDTCPHQVSAEIEAAVCEMRREHPRWGPLRLVHELAKAGVAPVPSRMSAYRALVRHGLIQPGARNRRKDTYQRWEREAAMALWQIDIMGGAFLAGGTEAKIVTGIDDHSRYCVICQVVVRATGRAVCLAFAAALARFGVPEEVLTDNGKQFTDRFGKGGEVLFDRICRDNGIIHRLTLPRHPTTTGKVERFHGSLRRELLDDAVPFADLAAAQAAVDAWRQEYNTTRPHQALGMASPAERFTSARGSEADQLLPLRLPAVLSPVPATEPGQGRAGRDFTHLAWPGTLQDTASGNNGAGQPAPDHPVKLAGVLPPGPSQDTGQTPAPCSAPDTLQAYHGGPVAFDRVVPASGNMQAAGRQFWLGPRRAGQVITFWADTDVIHLTAAGLRVKSVRSHLSSADLARLAATGARPGGPPPLPKAQPGAAIEVERVVSKDGQVHLAGRYVIAAEILGGRRVGVRIEQNTLMFFDPATRELLRTRPSPLTWDQARTIRGASPAGPPPRPSTEPVTAQRRASNTGIIMIAGQKIALGRIHAGRVVTVHVAEHTITIDLGGDDTRTVRRTTNQPVRSIKAHRPREVRATHVS
jgi:transposase InsO family protein